MEIVEQKIGGEHEQLLLCRDYGAGYRGIIAIHSTRLGPAVGGTRFWHYASEQEAITDALRLARGMTYKNALAGVPFGGGKSVIMREERMRDRAALLRAHGRFVNTLCGRYITAEDVGTNSADMEIVRQETEHVAGLDGKSGDPSPMTALGVFSAIQASAKNRWGSDDLAGKRVALQGCGNVGSHLARLLKNAGAHLIISDTDAARAARLASEIEAETVAPDEIFRARAHIFAPCALGGIINDETIPQLRVEIVCGAANNQLLEERHGDELQGSGILYAPDYAANAGGVFSGMQELLGWDKEQSLKSVRGIYQTLTNIFELAKNENIPTHKAANKLAEQRLQRPE